MQALSIHILVVVVLNMSPAPSSPLFESLFTECVSDVCQLSTLITTLFPHSGLSLQSPQSLSQATHCSVLSFTPPTVTGIIKRRLCKKLCSFSWLWIPISDYTGCTWRGGRVGGTLQQHSRSSRAFEKPSQRAPHRGGARARPISRPPKRTLSLSVRVSLTYVTRSTIERAAVYLPLRRQEGR